MQNLQRVPEQQHSLTSAQLGAVTDLLSSDNACVHCVRALAALNM